VTQAAIVFGGDAIPIIAFSEHRKDIFDKGDACQTCISLLSVLLERAAYFGRMTTEKSCDLGCKVSLLQDGLANESVACLHRLCRPTFSFYCLRLHSRIGRGPLDLAVVGLLYLDFKLVFWSSSAFCAKNP